MKYVSYIMIVYTALSSAYAQVSDTLQFNHWELTVLNSDCSFYDGVYEINDSVVDKRTYDSFVVNRDRLWDKIYEGIANLRFFQFYNENGILTVEGRWQIEFWWGEYKAYHPNGKLSEWGYYSTDEAQLGQKVGVWKYYAENGRFVLEEWYDEKGSLLKFKRY